MFDATGAYLHEDVPKDEKFIMKLQGKFSDIVCDVNP